jgi:hypothetical protein
MAVKKACKVLKVRNGKLFSAIVTPNPFLNSVAGRLYSEAHPIRFQQS